MSTKNKDQPHAKHPFTDIPKCGAHSRRTGRSCQAPAMKNGRCRMHGGLSPGAPKGNQNALKHGYYTKAAEENRRYLKQLIHDSQKLINDNLV